MSDAMYLAFRGTNMSGVSNRQSNRRSNDSRGSSDNEGNGVIFSSESKSEREAREAFPVSNMGIQLDNHFKAKVYTTGQTVSGTVSITTQRPVSFDYVHIALLGTTFTSGDNLSLAPLAANYEGRRECSQLLLRLEMPVPASLYPEPRVFVSGTTYSIPFNFVIPAHLTLGACHHHVDAPAVHEQHTRLPPTMGGSSSGGPDSARWERDDMAPEMARIEYCVKARVYRYNEDRKKPAIKVIEAVMPIRVLPVSVEDPPLSLSTKQDKNYKLQTSRTLRKGLLPAALIPSILRPANSRLGRLHASATGRQPAPILLSPDGRIAEATVATMQLHFEPAQQDVLPPRIVSVSAKLIAHTYFSSGTAMGSLPNMGQALPAGSTFDRHNSYYTSVNILSNYALPEGDFEWQSRIASMRRDSGYCSTNESDNDDHHCSGRHAKSSDVQLFYGGELSIPIQLPANKKTYLPTFHSCIASRVYALQLSVSVAQATTSGGSRRGSAATIGGGGNSERRGSVASVLGGGSSRRGSIFGSGGGSGEPVGNTTTFSLTVPVQIAVTDEHGNTAQPADLRGLPTFEAALEEADADAHLVPRIIGVPTTTQPLMGDLPVYGQ